MDGHLPNRVIHTRACIAREGDVSPCSSSAPDVPYPPPIPLEEAGHPPQGRRDSAVGFGLVQLLPKNSGDSSSCSNCQGWVGLGLGWAVWHGRTPSAPSWLFIIPPHISRAQCVPLSQARAEVPKQGRGQCRRYHYCGQHCQCSKQAMSPALGRRDSVWPLCHMVAVALLGPRADSSLASPATQRLRQARVPKPGELG